VEIVTPRYFFLADIVSVIWAATSAERRALYVALLVQMGSMLSIIAYATTIPWLVHLGFMAMALATAIAARALFKSAAAENLLMVSAA
jgi:hypothetical protein